MKVAIIADVLGEENNGTTIACMNLVRYLKSQGDEVTIVCCDENKRGVEGYAIVGTRNLGPLINHIVKKNNVSLAKPDKEVISAAIRDADIIHVMMPFALGKEAVKIARKMNKPVTAGFHVQAEHFTNHIGMMNSELANKLTYLNYYNHLYQYVDAIHYPTDFIRNLFEMQVHHRTNGYVISNGVNERFVRKQGLRPSELNDKYVILFTGRYSREKSHNVLIKAVSMSRYKDKIQLIFAGQGQLDNEIRKYALGCGINKPIMQFFSSEELLNVINYSDLYCHPAEVEIEAISCLEAIACGVVPIVSDSRKSATSAFAIDDKNLFKCNDSKDLARKIDYWIEHPEEKVARSKIYQEYAKNVSQQKCMSCMREMMTDCVKGHTS